MRIRARQIGFTLVELLIAMAIFGILAAFAVPSYQNMIENSKIKTATDSILAGLQIARAEAVKRNTSVQFDFRTDSAWTVCITPAGAGSCPTTDGATTIESRAVSEGSTTDVAIAESGGAGPYVFDSFGRLTSPATATTIDVTNPSLGSSRDLRVVIGVGGAVKSCDPALDSSGTDPRRC